VSIRVVRGLWIKRGLTLKVFGNSAEDKAWRLEEGSDRRLEKTAQWGASRLLLFTQYYYGEQIREFVMGGSYGMLGGHESFTYTFSPKCQVKDTHLAELGVDGRILLM